MALRETSPYLDFCKSAYFVLKRTMHENAAHVKKHLLAISWERWGSQILWECYPSLFSFTVQKRQIWVQSFGDRSGSSTVILGRSHASLYPEALEQWSNSSYTLFQYVLSGDANTLSLMGKVKNVFRLPAHWALKKHYLYRHMVCVCLFFLFFLPVEATLLAYVSMNIWGFKVIFVEECLQAKKKSQVHFREELLGRKKRLMRLRGTVRHVKCTFFSSLGTTTFKRKCA